MKTIVLILISVILPLLADCQFNGMDQYQLYPDMKDERRVPYELKDRHLIASISLKYYSSDCIESSETCKMVEADNWKQHPMGDPAQCFFWAFDSTGYLVYMSEHCDEGSSLSATSPHIPPEIAGRNIDPLTAKSIAQIASEPVVLHWFYNASGMLSYKEIIRDGHVQRKWRFGVLEDSTYACWFSCLGGPEILCDKAWYEDNRKHLIFRHDLNNSSNCKSNVFLSEDAIRCLHFFFDEQGRISKEYFIPCDSVPTVPAVTFAYDKLGRRDWIQTQWGPIEKYGYQGSSDLISTVTSSEDGKFVYLIEYVREYDSHGNPVVMYETYCDNPDGCKEKHLGTKYVFDIRYRE